MWIWGSRLTFKERVRGNAARVTAAAAAVAVFMVFAKPILLFLAKYIADTHTYLTIIFVAAVLSVYILETVILRGKKPDPVLYGKMYLYSVTAFFAVLMIRTAWLSDDAYISFRSAYNLITGHGLTWNPAERVQAFTNPLWTMIFSAFLAVNHDAYYSGLALGMLVSTAVFYLFMRFAGSKKTGMLLAASALIFSKAFIDFSTSGLETPLSNLIFVLFFMLYVSEGMSARKVFYLSLTAAAGCLNRLDASLLYVFPLLQAMTELGWARAAAPVLLGFTPLVFWEAFSLIYYGFPFPNTFYAKLNMNWSVSAFIRQGFNYLVNSLKWDPATIPLIAAGIAGAVVSGNRKLFMAAAGITAYLLYILRIGGDFMSGRFLVLPFTASVLVLLSKDLDKYGRLRIALAVIAALAGMSGKYSPVFSGASCTPHHFDTGWVTDERAFYYHNSGLLRAVNYPGEMPAGRVAELGRELRSGKVSVYDRTLVYGKIGYLGYLAGPDIFIVDNFALSDAFLSKLTSKDKDLYIGHEEREIPEGYIETVETGKNAIKDPRLREYYSHLSAIIRGPVFTKGRFNEIIAINTGKYDYLLK